MSQRTVIFRLEASLQIGTGHAMRCLVLAEKLQELGWKCYFATSATSIDLIKKLQNFPILDPQKFWNTPTYCDLLVVDNYDLDENYENHFRKFAAKILVIDDLANRKHNCDILLDQNLGTQAQDYKNLVNQDCQILTGTSYCLLREEFAKLRPLALEKRSHTQKIHKILVNFGGSDINNHTQKALEMIETSQFHGEIDAVLGLRASNLKSIKEFAKKSKNKINIYQEANMSEMILAADLALAAGGTSSWERCCLGLPTYIIKIAENQEKIFQQLGTSKSFDEFLHEVKNNYQEHAKKVAKLVDGKGADRIYQKLNS